MVRGAISGKKAQEYVKKIKSLKITKVYDKLILEIIKPSRTAKVCDFCCGPGYIIDLLKKRVKEIVGVDASEDMINICRKKFKNNSKIKIILTSVTDTGLKSNYFDYVIIRMGLHHIKDKESVMDEIYRILKPKGKAIVIDKFYMNAFTNYLREILRMFKFNFMIFGHFHKSRKYNERLVSKRFKIIRKKFFPIVKGYTTKSFMFVLEKK